MAFDVNLLKAFGYISIESGKWTEAQETIYEASKEVKKEEKYFKLGALSRIRQIQMKYLVIKK